MKAKVTMVLFLAGFSTFLLFSSACEEQNISSNKQARLVGNQNIELKKQLKNEARKHEIALEECEKRVQEQIKANEQAGNATLEVLKSFADIGKTNEELTLENQKLNEKIRELEAKLGISQ